MKPNEIKKTYDLFAEDYYILRKEGKKGPGFFNNLLEMPTTLALLGNVKNKKVLDLGCGPGIYLKLLTSKGAKIKGIDISENSVNIAKKENPKLDITVGDITKKLPYENSEFDIVLSSLTIGHIQDWGPLLREIRRILKKGGIFVFSNYNPVTEKTKKERWFFRTFRELDNYFEETWKKNIWTSFAKKSKIAHHHKTYGTIVRLLVGNGFEIIDYEDSFPSKDAKKRYPKEYQIYSQIPNFCTWKVKKK